VSAGISQLIARFRSRARRRNLWKWRRYRTSYVVLDVYKSVECLNTYKLLVREEELAVLVKSDLVFYVF
jgi:hypothetical protein